MKRRTERREEDIMISTASNDVEEARMFLDGDRRTISPLIPSTAVVTNFNAAE